ncbi:DUF6022 family protein [Cohnella zeiphila]|uniref:Uncharacterized protein n=1 Tax=Cohnella zeiphila TaxID=2761120 RepID=A0A7X0SPQ6_9BACL|nr:DUF6022 family protein [Cohnella zeiphila]MBB6733907.1 hypothetical protein [Cohnella zeiphila]
MSHLIETYHTTVMRMLRTFVQQSIDERWKGVWDRHLPELERIYAKGGDSAYGFFCLKLFQPLEAEMEEAGFAPGPVLPGAFPRSEEHWGPRENRERRFWSVIRQGNGKELGTLVTRVFHDHTRLRLPKPPQVYAIEAIDPNHISQVIMADLPESGSSTREGVDRNE